MRDPIFVWRYSSEDYVVGKHTIPDCHKKYICPFCSDKLRYAADGMPCLFGNSEGIPSALHCPCFRCGYWHTETEYRTKEETRYNYHISSLVNFDINDERLALDELGSHLKRKFSDIASITPRRFEKLIEDVFRNLGFQTHLTAASKDGGYDVVLLEGAGKKILVECKRYTGNNRVGVDIVRQLAGVMLFEKAPKAILVTSTTFSRPAIAWTETMKSRGADCHIDLVDAGALCKALNVYNTSLPPLEVEWPTRIND